MTTAMFIWTVGDVLALTVLVLVVLWLVLSVISGFMSVIIARLKAKLANLRSGVRPPVEEPVKEGLITIRIVRPCEFNPGRLFKEARTPDAQAVREEIEEEILRNDIKQHIEWTVWFNEQTGQKMVQGKITIRKKRCCNEQA